MRRLVARGAWQPASSILEVSAGAQQRARSRASRDTRAPPERVSGRRRRPRSLSRRCADTCMFHSHERKHKCGADTKTGKRGAAPRRALADGTLCAVHRRRARPTALPPLAQARTARRSSTRARRAPFMAAARRALAAVPAPAPRAEAPAHSRKRETGGAPRLEGSGGRCGETRGRRMRRVRDQSAVARVGPEARWRCGSGDVTSDPCESA